MILTDFFDDQLCYLVFVFSLLAAFGVLRSSAQQRQSNSGEDEAYDARFFDELRTIFGRFRCSDLQRVFQEAQPVQCTELTGRKGEWRMVAFFNDDRTLGDWYRERLDEVKSDLEIYTFKGSCSGSQSLIHITTEFPTEESMNSYKQGRINLNQIDITVNDPVDAVLNARTPALIFDLPYLFRSTKDAGASKHLYNYNAPDRNATYAPDLKGHWECKTVAAADVTYRFMICRVSLVPRGKLPANTERSPSLGSAAFFILSDGTEAQSHVKVNFGDEAGPEEKPGDASEPEAPVKPARPVLKRDK